MAAACANLPRRSPPPKLLQSSHPSLRPPHTQPPPMLPAALATTRRTVPCGTWQHLPSLEFCPPACLAITALPCCLAHSLQSKPFLWHIERAHKVKMLHCTCEHPRGTQSKALCVFLLLLFNAKNCGAARCSKTTGRSVIYLSRIDSCILHG